jgi:hypothetical protein
VEEVPVSVIQIERVLNHSQTRGADRAVLFIVAYHAHDDGSGAHPSLDRLAQESGRGRVTVWRSLRRIEALGELRVVSGGEGTGDTNRYTVTIAHAPGRISRCDASCRREGLHGETLLAARRVSERNKKGFTLKPEPSGTNTSPSERDRRPPAAAARRSDSSARSPDSRIPPCLDAFATAHQKALGQPYPVVGGRDGAALRRALRTWEPAVMTATLPAYFADPWTCEHGPTVAKWVGMLPSLLHQTRRRSSSDGFVG